MPPRSHQTRLNSPENRSILQGTARGQKWQTISAGAPPTMTPETYTQPTCGGRCLTPAAACYPAWLVCSTPDAGPSFWWKSEAAPGPPRGLCAVGSPDHRRNLWTPGRSSAICRETLPQSLAPLLALIAFAFKRAIVAASRQSVSQATRTPLRVMRQLRIS